MWPTRRASLGLVKNCSPASCLPESTSQRRNSARNLPSLLPILPTTRAWALIGRQSSKRGARVTSRPFSMKAAWSIGRNSPEDFRSFATTLEISRAVFASIEPSAEKSGMAMGIAWMLPWVMLSSTTACAGCEAAVPAMRAHRRRPATRETRRRCIEEGMRSVMMSNRSCKSGANRCHTSVLGRN